MKISMKVVICLLVFLSLNSSAIAAETFTRYLQQGDSGTDVFMLQKFLNSDEDTKVAEEGPGSPGQETSFFGGATKEAVIEYQKESNLGTEMGFFTMYSGAIDDKTRGFLNASTSQMARKVMTACEKPRESAGFGGIMSNLLNPTMIFDTFSEKKAQLHKGFMSGDVTTKWASLIGLGQIDIPTDNTLPFIARINVIKGPESILPSPQAVISAPMNNINAVMSGQLPTPLIKMPLGNSMVFEDGDTLVIFGCNFSSSVTVNLGMAGSQSASSNGTVVSVTVNTSIQDTIDNHIKKLLIPILPTDTDEEKAAKEQKNKEIRNRVLQAMQGKMSMPMSSDIPGSFIQMPEGIMPGGSGGGSLIPGGGSGGAGGGMMPKVLGATTDLIQSFPLLSSLPGLSQLLNLAEGKLPQSPLSTPFTGGQETPGMPVYITVENSGNRGVSNSYQLFFKPH